jgi:hypothetical protein
MTYRRLYQHQLLHPPESRFGKWYLHRMQYIGIGQCILEYCRIWLPVENVPAMLTPGWVNIRNDYRRLVSASVAAPPESGFGRNQVRQMVSALDVVQ